MSSWGLLAPALLRDVCLPVGSMSHLLHPQNRHLSPHPGTGDPPKSQSSFQRWWQRRWARHHLANIWHLWIIPWLLQSISLAKKKKKSFFLNQAVTFMWASYSFYFFNLNWQILQNSNIKGKRYSSGVQLALSKCKALNSIPSINKQIINK